MPIYDELVREDTLVVHKLHKGIEILLLTRLSLDEVEHYCLQKSLDTNLSVALYEFHEGWFVRGPTFYHIALILENTTKQDVVLVLRSDVQDQLNLPHFCKEVFNCALTLCNESV